ncbi:MAG: hypothetical protein AB7D28_04985 [Candidatus Berkiella sp.]
MSASGARPSNTINISSSIYAKMEPIKAEKKLKAALKAQYEESGYQPNQLWLLRESRVDGCLTLSSIERQENGSYKGFDRRYALVETSEGVFAWTNVSDEATLHALQQEQKIVFMNMHTARKVKNIELCTLLFDSFKAIGFLAEDYLDPSPQESSRNSIYIHVSQCNYIQNQLDHLPETESSSAEIIERLKRTTRELAKQHEDQICPISFEKPESVAAISQTPHLYNRKELQRWVAESGSDPMTRAPITMQDILHTRAPEKMHVALEEVTRRIAMRHMKST